MEQSNGQQTIACPVLRNEDRTRTDWHGKAAGTTGTTNDTGDRN